MIVAGLGGAALLIAALAGEPGAPAVPAPASTAAVSRFAPPLDRPMTYRVTTRRLGRDDSLLSFSLVYALEWRRAGRGYELDATLDRIESDARPDVTRALTAALQPLVGERMAYLVAPDGSSIDLVDADRLWERALARTAATGAAAGQGEAQQVAAMIAALPPAERDRLATADIRALVPPPIDATPAEQAASGVSVTLAKGLQTIAKVGPPLVPAGAGADAPPVQVDMIWTVDTATGLVVREQKQSWIVERESGARTLVEERVRALVGPGES